LAPAPRHRALRRGRAAFRHTVRTT
jgi:hypothetical protein